MGRPPGRIQNRILLMRVTEDFLKTIDSWRATEKDEPSKAEAVRRLVELGLNVKQWELTGDRRQSKKGD